MIEATDTHDIPLTSELANLEENACNCTQMRYEWNPAKAISNRQKHGISFADAITVFEDDWSLLIEDDFLYEQRFVTIGRDALGRILAVVHTYRGDTVRVISA